MNEKAIISRVKEKIKGKDISKHTDLNDYLVARDILLSNGFINNKNQELQQAYFELFPVNFKLEQELETSLKDIQSDDEQVREKASKYLQRKPSLETSMIAKLWLKEPRTINILCNVLEKEKNIKILENVILSLGSIARRYEYNDLSIFNSIVSKFDKANDRLKIQIAKSCSHFPTDKKWNYVYKALDCKPKKNAILWLTVAIINQHNEIPTEMKEKFKEKLLAEFYNPKNKNEQVKITALKTVKFLMLKKELTEYEKIITDT